ncbi:methanol/ethanol family PQQ-dependent dehydrogenase [Microvirga sp. G4-2]|uniref:methanol/ethanol family PQQ-dependent dehydrogenase n=1 Tax=Microvirga sp. G4-2 TaxID=3434467 RepID=UPI004043EF93
MGHTRFAFVLAALLLVQHSSLSLAQTQPQPSAPSFAATPEDGQWTIPQKNYANTRYSDLSEINTDNVKNLQAAFTFSTGVNRGHESAPLVVGTTMYVLAPYPNILYALDLAQPGAPLKWQYNPKPASAAQGVACCDVVNRGPTFANGRIFFTTLDAHVVAVNAETGEEVWKTKLGDINRGETMTMAPLVVKDKVVVGISGGEYGVRGWIQALDANTGQSVWKAYSTGPDQDVKIGPNFKPFYDGDKGKDLGVTTWPADAWQQGGGTVWGWLSYDPELNLLYHGTANPGPWNPNQRPGDNKWTAGIFARDADTGEARWFYQTAPHDLHDWDTINEMILLDLEWEGKPRKVLVHPGRTGFVYVIDRVTGEVLSATPFHALTAVTGVDMKTGRMQVNSEKEPVNNRVVRDICPAAPGAKDWNPSAFSHRTGLLYIPHMNLCMDWESVEPNYIAGTPYVGAEVRMYPGPGGHMGEFTAWDIRAGKELWTIKERFPIWSGALATAGDVVFYGTMEGWFKAVHARTGEVLWQFKTSSGIIGQPTTYRGPDGKQYVAILSGVGGWSGAIVSGDLDPRDGSAALGFVNAMRELKNVTTKGGTLYVFKLP